MGVFAKACRACIFLFSCRNRILVLSSGAIRVRQKMRLGFKESKFAARYTKVRKGLVLGRYALLFDSAVGLVAGSELSLFQSILQ